MANKQNRQGAHEVTSKDFWLGIAALVITLMGTVGGAVWYIAHSFGTLEEDVKYIPRDIGEIKDANKSTAEALNAINLKLNSIDNKLSQK